VLFDSMAKEIEEQVPHVVRAMPEYIAMST
jgi:hypothetical protein